MREAPRRVVRRIRQRSIEDEKMSLLSLFKKLFDCGYRSKGPIPYSNTTTVTFNPNQDIYAEAYAYGAKHFPTGYTMHVDKPTSTVTFYHR